MHQIFNNIYCGASSLSKLQLYDFESSLSLLEVQLDALAVVKGKAAKTVKISLANETDLETVNKYMRKLSSHVQQVFNAASDPYLYRSPFVCHSDDGPNQNNEGDKDRADIKYYQVGAVFSLLALSVLLVIVRYGCRKPKENLDMDIR